jgi:hypothetical protein
MEPSYRRAIAAPEPIFYGPLVGKDSWRMSRWRMSRGAVSRPGTAARMRGAEIIWNAPTWLGPIRNPSSGGKRLADFSRTR